MFLRTLLTAAILAVIATPASAEVTTTRTVNLDGDPDLEQVIPQEACIPFADGALASDCPSNQFAQRRIVIADTCNGAAYSRAVSSRQDAVVALVVSNFEDLTPRPEIFFDLRSGASARVGQIGIVSWDGPAPTACPQPRSLFLYPSKRTRGRVPRGAVAISSFDAVLRNVTKRYAGKEVRLTEFYVDRNDPLCCASFRRTTYFGYNAGKDLYVKFRTHVKRIRR